MTQLEKARAGEVTDEVRSVAQREAVDVELLVGRIAKGEVVIPKNRLHHLETPIGIGKGLRTKINANIGTSTDHIDPFYEVEKAKVAISAGSDAIMDLSTGGDLEDIRGKIMKAVFAVIGTVPVYQAAVEAIHSKGALIKMTIDDIFSVLERQAKEGVDFFTVHCGVTLSSIERLKNQGRLMDIVSRGGSILTTWMIANHQENPFYEYFDRVLEIAYKYDVTLSLGDGLRPGSLQDATDRAQIQELITLGELTKRAWEKNVQIIIEGPGHVPLHQIKMNIELQKSLCANAPFYVLGPIVTDIAPGYDHITSAIGGAMAAWAGADFLCYVTPGEHLKLPNLEEVRQGVIATKIAGHAADIAKGVGNAIDWDIEMSSARKKLDWEKQVQLAIDPDTARKMRIEGKSTEEQVCSMCGEYCAIRLVEEALHPNPNKKEE